MAAEIALRLANGVVINNAAALTKAKFEQFQWEWYDGVVTDPNAIEPTDFAITIAMNSRATAMRMKNFMLRRTALEELLRGVPQDTHLAGDTPARVYDAVACLFEEACRADGTALAVASKVLHRKRPSLIPMLDRIVVDHHYWLALSGDTPPTWFDKSWLKNGAWSDPTRYMRVMAEELDANRSALAALRSLLAPTVPASISDVRLLEATLYAHLQA